MILKTDISELKNRLKPNDLSITRLKGAYMSTDAGIITRIDERFLALPEDEFYKYLDIARSIFQPKQFENKNLELLDIAIKAKVPEFYAERISGTYGRRYSGEWPKLIWLFNQKLCTLEHAKQHKDKTRNLLGKAGRALDQVKNSELVEEIDRYLERNR